jgi:hypothetical protein
MDICTYTFAYLNLNLLYTMTYIHACMHAYLHTYP